MVLRRRRGVGRWPPHAGRLVARLPAERAVLTATVFALTAAGLHAAWNLVAKRSADPFLALWGQFFVAGLVGAVVLVATRSAACGRRGGGPPSPVLSTCPTSSPSPSPTSAVTSPSPTRWPAAAARCWPAIGGIVLLGDDVGPWSVAAIVIVAGGMAMLAVGADRSQVAVALFVALTIGAYTLVDSHASRTVDDWTYTFAVFVGGGVSVTAYGLAAGRRREMVAALGADAPRFLATAAMSMATYGLVLAAVRRAPVGYVAALRESSVLAAAFLGRRYLDEGSVRRRTVASAVILGGLVLLIISV